MIRTRTEIGVQPHVVCKNCYCTCTCKIKCRCYCRCLDDSLTTNAKNNTADTGWLNAPVPTATARDIAKTPASNTATFNKPGYGSGTTPVPLAYYDYKNY